MIRNLKVLGMAFAALLALSAMSASVASAEVKGQIIETSANYPVHVHGEDTPEAVTTLTGPSLEVHCDEATYTGTLPAASTSLTITPTYGKCVAGARFATVTMNGCHYKFHNGTEVTGGWKMTADLECPPEKIVEIHVFNNAAHTQQYSTVTIGPQTNLEGLTATNETKPDAIDIHGKITTIKAQTHGACSFGFTINTETTLHVAATVEGTEGKEIQIVKH